MLNDFPVKKINNLKQKGYVQILKTSLFVKKCNTTKLTLS